MNPQEIIKLLKPYLDANGLDTTESLVRDLLSDLMHICDYWQVDFQNELRIGSLNYQAEVKENSRLDRTIT